MYHHLQVMVQVFCSFNSFSGNRKQGLIIGKSLTLHFKSAMRSFIYTRKNNGPKKEPWGTPAKISPQLEHCPFRTVLCFWSFRKLLIREIGCPEAPHRSSLWMRGSQSNAWKIVRVMEINWLIVESPGRSLTDWGRVNHMKQDASTGSHTQAFQASSQRLFIKK